MTLTTFVKERVPSKLVLSLCGVMLVQAYLLISVFTYSGFLVMFLLNKNKQISDPSYVNPSSAGYYAGYLASAFMFGRTFSSYLWGKFADIYGRKVVLIISLSAAAIFSVMLGFATSLPVALLARFMMGFFNAIPGTIKTLVSELGEQEAAAKSKSKNPQDSLEDDSETKAAAKKWTQETMGIVFGMWGYGFLIGPALAGALADPVAQYSDSRFVQNFLSPVFGLVTFPFLLPNLVGAILAGVAAVTCVRLFEEVSERSEPSLNNPRERKDAPGQTSYRVQFIPSKDVVRWSCGRFSDSPFFAFFLVFTMAGR